MSWRLVQTSHFQYLIGWRAVNKKAQIVKKHCHKTGLFLTQKCRGERIYLCPAGVPVPEWQTFDLVETFGKNLSGRKDLNLRPLGPEPSALAGLSHAPNECDYTLAVSASARAKFVPRRTSDYCRNTCSAAVTWAALSGSKKLKRLPFPSTLSTQILPPCISTISLAMASPRPMPLCLRVRCFSTW